MRDREAAIRHTPGPRSGGVVGTWRVGAAHRRPLQAVPEARRRDTAGGAGAAEARTTRRHHDDDGAAGGNGSGSCGADGGDDVGIQTEPPHHPRGLMDPKIGWYQPEQFGPAKDLWLHIWETEKDLDNLNLKQDGGTATTALVSPS